MPIVQNPTAGDVHVNRPLTNFSQKYLQAAANFVAGRASPNIPVSKQSDLYYIFDREDFYRDEAEERADGTESAGGGFNLSTDPYFARVWAYHKDVTDRQRANQDEVIGLDRSAAQFVTHKLLIRKEQDFVTRFFQSGIWSQDRNVNWAGTTDDPIVQIREEMDRIEGTTGYRPNKLTIGRRGYSALLDNDAVLARISGGSTNAMPAKVQMELLAQLFELDAIYVMGGVINRALEGAEEATGFINNDDALLYYAPDTVGLEEPTAMATFSWTGLMGNTENGMRIKRFRQERLEADRIEGQMAFDHRVVATELATLFLSVATA